MPCNICGGETFLPGPNDRLSQTGRPPRCAGCYSLERHRQLRVCLDLLPPGALSWRRAIQFAPDPSLEGQRFASFETSQFGGENSLDLQDLDRPTGVYDFISLSSVLEFVVNDRRAFAELARIGSPKCIIHCTFTPASEDSLTHHYDRPHGNFGRMHLYGADLVEWFRVEALGFATIKALPADPATGVVDPIHFFCRQITDMQILEHAFAECPSPVTQ